MMRRLAALFLCLVLFGRPALADPDPLFPLPPTVYLGDYGQGAVMMHGYHGAYEERVTPSVITEVWFDGGDSLYMVLAPEPIRLYRWVIGTESAELLAFEEAVAPLAAELRAQAQTTVESEIPSHPALENFPFETIDEIIPLPGDRLAIVCYAEGISILNTTLPLKTLTMDASVWEYHFFQANPDVREIESLHSTFYIYDEDGYLDRVTKTPLREYMTATGGTVDVYSASAPEVDWARKEGLLADFSASALLSGMAESYYPAVWDLCGTYALPTSAEPDIWLVYTDGWERLGLGSVPTTVDGLFEAEYKLHEHYRQGVTTESTLDPWSCSWLAPWLETRYITLYAQPDAPLSFDTEEFRDMMRRTRRLIETDWPQLEAGERTPDTIELRDHLLEPYLLWQQIYWDREVIYQPMIPPVFEEGQTPRVELSLSTVAIHAGTEKMPEAIRLLEHVARYTPPIYVFAASTVLGGDIYAPDDQAYQELVARGWDPGYLANWRLCPSPLFPQEAREDYHENFAPYIVCNLGATYYWQYQEYTGYYFEPSLPLMRYLMGEVDLDWAIEQMDALAMEKYGETH